MAVQWIAGIRWAGNLQNIPLPGNTKIVDYRQIEPGLIEIDILCEDPTDLLLLVCDVTKDMWCSRILVEPYFEGVTK